MSIFANEAGAEVLKAVRAPEFILPTLLMPCAFYTIFGVVLSSSSDNAAYLLATYGVFAVMAPSIFGFGVGVAVGGAGVSVGGTGVSVGGIGVSVGGGVQVAS